nr:MAG TPA: hypothetical protein [Caudoviricetes sp.]
MNLILLLIPIRSIVCILVCNTIILEIQNYLLHTY